MVSLESARPLLCTVTRRDGPPTNLAVTSTLRIGAQSNLLFLIE